MYFRLEFVGRQCWDDANMCYKRNLDRHWKMYPSQVLKMNPSFSSFTKLEHKSDESAWWGLCRAPPKVWQLLVLYFLASCLDRREEEYRKRLVLYCPLNICFLWEKQSQWFQPPGLQGSLQTKHISGSFRKNILKVFGLQGNTLNRQLILSRLFFWP